MTYISNRKEAVDAEGNVSKEIRGSTIRGDGNHASSSHQQRPQWAASVKKGRGGGVSLATISGLEEDAAQGLGSPTM